MEQAMDRVRTALERVAWKWAEEGRVTTRRDCAPLVTAIMERAQCATSAEIVEGCVEEFCEMVLARKQALIEMQRLEIAREAIPVRTRRVRP